MVASVSIQKIYKRYDKVTVVKGIDLEIQPGEFVVLVGPSGCGKSTTLRMVAGLEDITEGTISIDGKVINSLAPKDRGVSMVFQNYALYPHLDVYENICFGLRLRKVKKDEIHQAVMGAAEILGLVPLLKRKPSELSGGQRQRVAMGRSIVRQPKVFLFDEPLSNLDAKLRNQMRAEIKRLHQRLGNTMIYVTHDQVEAMTLADRIVVMRDGVIEQVGSPMELFNHPANTFVAGFMGSPPMNLLPAKIVQGEKGLEVALDGGNRISLSQVDIKEAKVGQSVIFGIRPEDITLGAHHEDGRPQLNGFIDIVEPLGSESIVHVKLGESHLVARTSGREPIAEGVTAPLFVDLSLVHLFDAETTLAMK